MYKMCKTEQSAQRQRQLELGLMEVMMNHHYDEITVSDLCLRMQIPRKSFYRYFSGKDGALHALIDHTLLEFDWVSDQEPVGDHRLRLRLERFFRFWQAQKVLLDALQRSSLSGVLIERAINQAAVEAGVESHFSGRVDMVERHNVVMFIVCGLMSMVLQWHHGGYETSAEQMAAVAVRIMTTPLFRGK